MTYSTNSFYVTFGGGLISGTEQWQTGFHCAPTIGGVPSALFLEALGHISVHDIWTVVANHLNDKITYPKAKYTQAQSVEWAKVAAIGQDGKYLGEPIVWEEQRKGPDPISTADAPQITPVISLWAGKNLGRANRGRMYVLCPYEMNNMLDPFTGRLPDTTVNQLATAWAGIIRNIVGEVSTIELPVSAVIMSKIGTGTTNAVSKVGCGAVLDTHRSRRRKLDDTIPSWVTL